MQDVVVRRAERGAQSASGGLGNVSGEQIGPSVNFAGLEASGSTSSIQA